MTTTLSGLFDTEQRTSLDVEHAFDMEIFFQPLQSFTGPASGLCVDFIVDRGVARGPLFNGELIAGGGDWVRVGTDGVARLDVRATLRADDGHLVALTNRGRAVFGPEQSVRYGNGELVEWDDAYVRSAPLFETDSEIYDWMNQSVFVAMHEVSLDRVHYRVYRVG